MDIVFTNHDRRDTAVGSDNISFDIDIGKENDFLITLPLNEYDKGKHLPHGYWYVPGTEFGGELNDPKSSTANSTISFSGDTFRGRLNHQIIEPPAGEDYLYVYGELNSLIRRFVNDHFDDIYVVTDADTGIYGSFKIPRNCTVLDGINYVLSEKGYHLKITVLEGIEFSVLLESAPIRNLSDEIEISQDYGIDFVIQRVTNRYEYMLLLGSGELKDRYVKKYKLLSDNTIQEISSFPKNVKVYKYDYPNYEGNTDEIIEKFHEINKTDNQEIAVNPKIILELGDIVGGRDYVSEEYIESPVTTIIVKYDEKQLNYSYEIGVVS